MIDSNYNNNLNDQVPLIALDETNMPSSDAGSDSEEETLKETKVCKWISDYEDVSVSLSVIVGKVKFNPTTNHLFRNKNFVFSVFLGHENARCS